MLVNFNDDKFNAYIQIDKQTSPIHILFSINS